MVRLSSNRAFLVALAISSCQDRGAEAFSGPTSWATTSPGRTHYLPVQKATSLQSQPSENDANNEIQNRRKAVGTISTALVAGLLGNTDAASAYDKTFPVELDTVGADIRTPREKALATKKPKRSAMNSSPLSLGLGAFLWGSALWFLSGSRSNPLATPVANILYDAKEEGWLKDRNEGLFGELPAPLLVLLGAMFLLFGFSVHVATISLTDGSVNISLQLAGVLLIGAGALEIGRIASGEKKQTRVENDRDAMLEQEFNDFAEKRLILGGNCHRNEVVQSFRRFHAKYRQADSTDYPLNDLEIEQLLRHWNERNAQAQRSSAGFYNGIQINADADVFVQR